MDKIDKVKITPRERQLYNALPSSPASSGMIAQRAGVSSRAIAARYCVALEKKGLALRHGSGKDLKWSRVKTKVDQRLDEAMRKGGWWGDPDFGPQEIMQPDYLRWILNRAGLKVVEK